ncbi:unnamed protein product, partial [marine sediment metagenome]
TELKKALPKKNTKVKTTFGEGKVADVQILTQLVMVELEDARRITVPLEELEIIPPPATTKKEENDTSEGKEQADEPTNNAEDKNNNTV